MSAQPFDHILRHELDEQRRGWVYLLALALAAMVVIIAIATVF